MSTTQHVNWLDLQTLGSQPIMPKNLSPRSTAVCATNTVQIRAAQQQFCILIRRICQLLNGLGNRNQKTGRQLTVSPDGSC
jgi:hypothetical protein